MADIWEKYAKDKKYVVDNGTISSYVEVWDPGQKTVPVNIHFRLDQYLMSNDENEENGKLMEAFVNDPRYQEIVNLFFHYIAQTERIKGLTALDIAAEKKAREIENNCYGKRCRDLFLSLCNDHQKKITRVLVEYDKSGQRNAAFEMALKSVFPKTGVYFEESKEIYHLHLDEPCNEYNAVMLELVCFLFLDMKVQIEALWENVFSVIGRDETMVIDEILIF